MKKKKLHKTNAMRILEQQKIPFQEHTFPWSEEHLGTNVVAKELEIEENRIFKTLVAVGNQTGPLVAVIPGDQALDLKKLAKASDNKKVEMLHLKELEPTTGYIRGGCSPVGMKKLFPTYLGEQAAKYDTIIVSAGQRGFQMELSGENLLSVTKGKLVDITV